MNSQRQRPEQAGSRTLRKTEGKRDVWSTHGAPSPVPGALGAFSPCDLTHTGTMMPFPDATPDGGHRRGQRTRCSPAKLDGKPCHPNTKAILSPGSFSSNLFGPSYTRAMLGGAKESQEGHRVQLGGAETGARQVGHTCYNIRLCHGGCLLPVCIASGHINIKINK